MMMMKTEMKMGTKHIQTFIISIGEERRRSTERRQTRRFIHLRLRRHSAAPLIDRSCGETRKRRYFILTVQALLMHLTKCYGYCDAGEIL